MTTRRRPPPVADSGASLIMAIAFVLVVGMISAGLIGLTTSSLSERTTLQALRNRQYAADAAVVYAVAQVRLLLTCTPSAGSIEAPSLNGLAVRVDWKSVCSVVQSGDPGIAATAAASDGTVVAQRNVEFAACLSPSPAAACDPQKVIIRAVVNFQQNSVGGVPGPVTRTYVQTWSMNL